MIKINKGVINQGEVVRGSKGLTEKRVVVARGEAADNRFADSSLLSISNSPLD